MHNFLDYVQIELGGTDTYAWRLAGWIPADPDQPGWDGRLGTLIIKQRIAKGSFRKRVIVEGDVKRTVHVPTQEEVDFYAVEEDVAEPWERPGRTFHVAKVHAQNIDDPADAEVYRVCIGETETCKCKAGQTRNPVCKHRDALIALNEMGVLPCVFQTA